MAADTWRAAAAIRDAIDRAPGLAVRGDPDATVFAFGGEVPGGDGAGDGIDTFALGDQLADRGGWYFDRQSPPDSLHATVHAGHAAVADELADDIGAVAAELASSGAIVANRDTTYGTA